MMKVSSMSMEANAIAVGMTAGSNLGRPATVSTMTDNVSHEPTHDEKTRSELAQ